MNGFIRYRNVIDHINGPITHVTAWQQRHAVLGDYFESVASLSSEFCAPKSTNIYAHGAGGGASKFKIIAVHKAISEALERWAFYHISLSGKNEKTNFGLDTDPTSTGFACHPSLFSNEVRKKSNEEAIERWSVYNWWLGRLPARIHSKRDDNLQIEIIAPFADINVFCSALKTENGLYVYGFSASDSLEKSRTQAMIEQARNKRALLKIPAEHSPSFWGDKRLIHFSTAEGFSQFKEKLEKSLSHRSLPEKPRKIVDREARGPWSRYARVWRTLYEGGEEWQKTADEKIFLF